MEGTVQTSVTQESWGSPVEGAARDHCSK
uniref:Uncharacterized protein n=1 Tax=Anguilla anguilla TaxID=7936 RepID=A0A0E9XL34_ANGAN